MWDKKKAPLKRANVSGGTKARLASSFKADSSSELEKLSSHSTRWKELERTAARKLGGRRVVRQDFFESSPDVVVDDLQLIVECKAHKRFSFHRHLEQAAKYCYEGETPCLVTKEAGQVGEFVTLPLDRFVELVGCRHE